MNRAIVGDPSKPRSSLLTLVREIKKHGKDVWLYTGFTLEELIARNNPHELQLISMVDTLVYGRYIQEQRFPEVPWRGSRNSVYITHDEIAATLMRQAL